MTAPMNQYAMTLSHRTRWVAIATVCVTAAATLTANGAFLMTAPLILGLIADAVGARRSRWLMWFGAALLTITMLQMEIVIFPEFVTELRTFHKLGGLGPVLLPLWIASSLLIVWCDVALVIDAFKASNGQSSNDRNSCGVGDWIVWLSAVLLSAYSFLGVPFLLRAYKQGFDRRDIVLTTLTLVVMALVFDIALIIDASRMRHAWRP